METEHKTLASWVGAHLSGKTMPTMAFYKVEEEKNA